MPDNRTLVVGIGGPSGSGNSLFAELLSNRLEEHFSIANLSADSYYRPRPDLTDQEKASINYDHPDVIEANLLIEDVAKIRRGKSVKVPVYDFSQHDRLPETCTIESPDILIVDGILIFHWAELCDQFDLKIFADVPLDICLSRRIKRDSGQRGRTPDSVRQQFETHVRPMYKQYVKPTAANADILMPGGGNNAKCLEAVVAWCCFQKSTRLSDKLGK